MTQPRKILYITGSGRSGSTLLGNVLGQIPGFFHAGELRGIWGYALREGRLCGCGQTFPACSVWSAVLDDLFNKANPINAQEMIRLRDKVNSLWWKMVLPPAGTRHHLTPPLQPYLDSLERLCTALQTKTASHLLIDSSKLPALAYLYTLLPQTEVYILHLIRHPQAVAYSWQRKKAMPSANATAPSHMSQLTAAQSAREWAVRQGYVRLVRHSFRPRYLMLNYETFVQAPQETTQKILDFIDEPTAPTPFISSHEVKNKGINHTLIGNPNRFQTDTITIRPDMRWQTALSARDKTITNWLTWPVRKFYGY